MSTKTHDKSPVIFIESPYAGNVVTNVEYAKAAMLDSIKRGETPIVAHLMFPRAMDDGDPRQRELALRMCRTLRTRCDAVAFYVDLGTSDGMRRAMEEAAIDGIIKDIRCIFDWSKK